MITVNLFYPRPALADTTISRSVYLDIPSENGERVTVFFGSRAELLGWLDTAKIAAAGLPDPDHDDADTIAVAV